MRFSFPFGFSSAPYRWPARVPRSHGAQALVAATVTLLVASVVAFPGCSASPRGEFPDEAKDAGAVEPSGDAGAKPPSFTDGGVPDTGAPKGPSEIFGHSGTTLYRLDPDTKSVQVIGPFAGCGTTAVIDIALDEASNMYGTTSSSLYRIDKANAKCTKVADAPSRQNFPNSLSFVPKGTLDKGVEALVGYVDDVYVSIDPQTGKLTTVGKLDNIRPSRVRSSGDIVSVIGGPTYLTVTGFGNDPLPQCQAADCLVEIDPVTGSLVKNLGPLNARQDVFGVAFWAGAIYGFSKSGSLFQVQTAGGTLTLTEIAIPAAPAGLSFFGAGSTTSAPVLPK